MFVDYTEIPDDAKVWIYPSSRKLYPTEIEVIEENSYFKKENGEFEVSLYDIESDIGEQKNLAVEFPQVVEKLTRMLKNFDDAL